MNHKLNFLLGLIFFLPENLLCEAVLWSFFLSRFPRFPQFKHYKSNFFFVLSREYSFSFSLYYTRLKAMTVIDCDFWNMGIDEVLFFQHQFIVQGKEFFFIFYSPGETPAAMQTTGGVATLAPPTRHAHQLQLLLLLTILLLAWAPPLAGPPKGVLMWGRVFMWALGVSHPADDDSWRSPSTRERDVNALRNTPITTTTYTSYTT